MFQKPSLKEMRKTADKSRKLVSKISGLNFSANKQNKTTPKAMVKLLMEEFLYYLVSIFETLNPKP